MRADHLIYVSLKYTRTVDVLKTILQRLIASFDNCIDALLKLNVETGKLPEPPSSVMGRIASIKEMYPHPVIESLLRFYIVMRKLSKADPIRSNEYRRGVRMNAILKGVVIEVDIDNIEEYFKRVKTFYKICTKLISRVLEGDTDPDLEDVIHGVSIDIRFERG